MELETVKSTVLGRISMLFHRSSLHPLGSLCFIVILWSSIFPIAFYGPRFINGIQNPAEYGACGTCDKPYDLGYSDSITNDASLSYRALTSQHGFGCMCPKSYSFCFPSTLSKFSDEENNRNAAPLEDECCKQCGGTLDIEPTQDNILVNNKSWSSDFGMFELLDGGIVSCSLNSREGKNCLSSLLMDGDGKNNLSSCRSSFLRQKTKLIGLKESKVIEPVYGSRSSLPNVEITPPFLDWGHNYLYFSSTAFLTIENTCNDSILHIYDPFSTDSQFYSCNFSEISIGPGESASLCFVFLPTLLGESSAHLILQTSLGGFVIKAKGYAVESPLVIEPLNGLDLSPGGKLSKNLSLFNPFNETIYVEEVTAWILVPHGQLSHLTEAVCSINSSQVVDRDLFISMKDWLAVRSGGISSPMVGIRVQRNWEISPCTSQTVMETEFSVGLKGKILGAFGLQLLRASKNKTDIVMVPFQAELEGIGARGDLPEFVSLSLESLVDQDTGETIVTISLKNDGQNMLNFVKVIEHSATNVFEIKYSGGLLLFPSSITQVAAITCANLTELHLSFGKISNLHQNCKLLVQTNASSTQIEIACQDIIYLCASKQRFSSVGLEHKYEDVDSGSTIASYEGSTTKLDLQLKAQQIVQLEELMLRNWSQGTTERISILKIHEVLFPMIQVGSYFSKWITLKNPCPHPIAVQLILNSREVINECKSTGGSYLPTLSRTWLPFDETTPTKHGFLQSESPIMEAYVHPHVRALLGPILFYPSNQCQWKSSSLTRSNLSGIEWLPLTGFGGLFYLAFLKGSEIIQYIHLNTNVGVSLNFCFAHACDHKKEMTVSCSRPLSEEFCAKNMGDMPLDVKRIEVSGSDCQLDGFVLHSCRGFILEPREVTASFSRLLSKEHCAKNIGDMPLDVKRIEVSGSDCQLDGFVVHSCGGFTLEPGESGNLIVSCQNYCSAASVHRDVEVAMASGILVIPLKATCPPSMLSNCRKLISWTKANKSFVVLLFIALLVLWVCCISPQIMAAGSQDYLWNNQKNSTDETVCNTGKTSLAHCNQKRIMLSIPLKMDNLFHSSLSTLRGYLYGQGRVSEKEMSLQETLTLESDRATNDLHPKNMEGTFPSTRADAFNVLEASELGDLTIKTVKEKGKKRRKRKGAAAKFNGLFEASSSQSGNSTPSSPLSPFTAVIPNHKRKLSLEVERSMGARNLFAHVADESCQKGQALVAGAKAKILEPKVAVQNCSNNNSFLSPQEHNPLGGKPDGAMPMSSANRATPYAFSHSPISRPKTSKPEEKAKPRDKYEYDIWGDHLAGLHLIGSSKDVTPLIHSPEGNNFNSFFIGGPHILTTASRPKSVLSLNQES